MITKDKIDRINELSRASKTRALSDEEKDEQAKLRREYIDAFKANLKSQLDQIEVVKGIEKSKGVDTEDIVVEIQEKMS